MKDAVRSVAVLGTGIMGAPIAGNIARSGLETRAWNRTREKAEPLAGEGIEVMDSPATAVEGAAAAITMLTDADAVRAVMTGDGGALPAMRDDAVWCQMSTIGIEGTEEMTGHAADRGVQFVDAPVVGTKQPAEGGELIVLASGPDDGIDRCQPIFEAVGSRTVRLGKAGGGTRMKLVVNNWLLALVGALAETVALAERIDVDPADFLDLIKGGPIGPPYAELKGRMMIEREFPPAFPLRLVAKDAHLVRAAAWDAGVELRVIPAVEELVSTALEQGHGDEDMAAAYYAAADSGSRRG
ncbi:MAG TPA: NAD(P)-dependent oxidoreductase [Solirubrobacterales bacterium]|jgi:3-hydroxyisobutyrate dehydrogenase|nr:NAD(P)-dependent oxidoreductase [Solirubrobacterales bacterium]